MTEQSNQFDNLAAWWETVSFPGKNLFELKENGELVLQSLHNYKERVVGNININNGSIVIKALSDKFQEVAAKMHELQTEWDASADKQKLIGKVERMREYLKHANAVGNFETLLEPLLRMEQTVDALSKENHESRLAIISEAEALADTEDWKDGTQKFKDIANKWKNIGQIDKYNNDELWNRLEAAKTKFFDRKRLHNEDVEKDMLQNLDLKLEIIEKAENHAASEDWKNSTEVFKQLMEDWKNTGRTVAEKNESLWNRLITAKNVFYDRKKLHFESIQLEQQANLELKQKLVEKADALKESTDWNKTTQEYTEMMDEWKKIGRVPLEKSEEIWQQFNNAREVFFQAKRQHFESVKISLEDNYAQKMALLKRAEVLQHSRYWREATEEMNELMNEWKKIGAVPREHSNAIWEQFIAARKNFFGRKDADREKRIQHTEEQRVSRIKQTRDFVYKLEEELKEEQDRLEDFKNGLENITPGRKENELREHLQKLIAQTKTKIVHKQEKLDEMRKQMQEIDEKEKHAANNTDANASAEENA